MRGFLRVRRAFISSDEPVGPVGNTRQKKKMKKRRDSGEEIVASTGGIRTRAAGCVGIRTFVLVKQVN